jgi:hypothetical protein
MFKSSQGKKNCKLQLEIFLYLNIRRKNVDYNQILQIKILICNYFSIVRKNVNDFFQLQKLIVQNDCFFF